MPRLPARVLPLAGVVAAAAAALGAAAPPAHAAPANGGVALPGVDHVALAEDRPWRLFAYVAPGARETSTPVLRLVADAAGDPDDGIVHVVAAGESLADIAAAYDIQGEDGWRRLFDANEDLEDPNRIEPGDELRIPDPEAELEPRELPARTATPAGGGGAATVTGNVWDLLARCESNGNWRANTGNGYHGGLQFHPQTWTAHGGQTYAPYAHEATRAQQIAVAERVRASQGWSAWPACTREIGLR